MASRRAGSRRAKRGRGTFDHQGSTEDLPSHDPRVSVTDRKRDINDPLTQSLSVHSRSRGEAAGKHRQKQPSVEDTHPMPRRYGGVGTNSRSLDIMTWPQRHDVLRTPRRRPRGSELCGSTDLWSTDLWPMIRGRRIRGSMDPWPMDPWPIGPWVDRSVADRSVANESMGRWSRGQWVHRPVARLLGNTDLFLSQQHERDDAARSTRRPRP